VAQLPTLLNSCARAATAEEARFRVDYPNSKPRTTRIFALDAGAATVIGRVAQQRWNGAHFCTYERTTTDASQPDAILRLADGSETLLSDELEGADVAIMISTTHDEGEGAATIGMACALRKIMTAGLVVGSSDGLDDAITALRPHASMLVVAAEEDFVPQMLLALRA
jgi:hypothetical protein